jgi:hypothetical protein
MRGICKLCKKEAKLEESHFIPKFIGKWVKKTSITGYLREKIKCINALRISQKNIGFVVSARIYEGVNKSV